MSVKLPWKHKGRKQDATTAPDTGTHQKKKKRRGISKKVLVPLCVVVVIAGVLFARQWAGTKAGAVEKTYSEEQAERRDVTLTLSSTGTVAPANQYNVTASVKGDVLSSTFEEGDTVQKGQTLYEIDKTEAQNTIERAKLSLQKSQNSYQEAQESLSDLSVQSDVGGSVTEVYVKVGDQVQQGTKIADVRDNSVMELKVPFNAADAEAIAVGSTANITMDGSFETLSGTVSAVDGVETVLDGYQIVKNVTIRVDNPGGLSTSSAASATIGGVACNGGGTFTYISESTITSSASGKVSELSISEGTQVGKGQTVAKLTSTSLQNQVKSSALSVQDAQLSYQNTVDQLKDYTITAPISGTVITKNTKVGDTLDTTSGQATLAVIYDLSYLTFDISLDELDVSQVAVGQTVDITCDSLDGVAFEGKVTKVSVAGTTENGVTTYPVTVQIDNPPADLLPGMNVDASIVVSEAANAVTVPVGAVQRGDVVYVRDESAKNTDNTLVGGSALPDGWRAAEVTTGLSDGSYIEILSGVSVGDTVYVPQLARSSSEEMPGMEGGMTVMPAGDMSGGPPSGGGDFSGGGMSGGGGGRPSGGGGGMP